MSAALRKLFRVVLLVFSVSRASVQAQDVFDGRSENWGSASYPLAYGTLDIINGGSLWVASAYVGYSGTVGPGTVMGGNATATVTGSGSEWRTGSGLFVGYFAQDNVLNITNGGTVKSQSGTIYSGTNVVNVTGMSSNLTIGIASTPSGLTLDGTLTLADSGLLRLAMTNGTLNIGSTGLLQLNNGFVAWNGDHTTEVNTFLTDGKIQVWNGATWVNANGNSLFASSYFSDESAAFAVTGYTGLAGYTILSMTSAIPEPSTYASIAGLLGLGLAMLRRKKA